MRDADPTRERIVLLAEYESSGGTRTYLKQLLDFYAARGSDVVLVGAHASPDAELAGWLEGHGFTFTPFGVVLGVDPTGESVNEAKVWSITHLWRERRAFRRFVEKVGARGIVVSAGTPGRFAGAAGAADDSIYILHTYPHGRRQEQLGRWLMPTFFKEVRQLVAVSQFQRGEMVRLWRMKDRAPDIDVIPNTTGDAVAPLTAVPDTEDAPLEVITASWAEPYKEPFEWLEVASRVATRLGRDRVRFTWLGEGSLLQECQKAAEARQGTVDATFAGHRDDVEAHYRRAAVYLQLSSTENMSLSTIDALRFGVPTVATAVGGLPEIVEHEVTGLLIPVHDIGAATEAVIRLLDDDALRARLSRSAHERYAAQFALPRWTERMTRLHDEVFGAAETQSTSH